VETAAIPFNTGESSPCPSCGAETIIEVFPAMFHPIAQSGAGEKITSPEEAACFYHPLKKAAVPCDSCGRFLCSLCDVELNGQHLCPNCLQSGKKKGKLRNLENERALHDHAALMLSTLPLILFPFTLFSAPAALYLSIRHWKSPSSLVPRWSKLRFLLAIFFSLIQIAGWLVLAVYFIKKT
jgi:hypothetical protein